MLTSKPRTWRPASLARIPLLPLVWFLLALSVFFASAVVTHLYSIALGFQGFFPIAASGDDRLYWGLSRTLAAGGAVAVMPSQYPAVLAFIYRLFTPDLFLGQIFSVLAGAITVYTAVLLAGRMTGRSRFGARDLRHPCNVTGMLLVFYPSLLLYSTQLLRDAYITLFGVVAVYAAYQLVGRFNAWYATAFLGALVVEYALRPYAALGVAAGLGVGLVFTMSGTWRTKARVAAVLLTLAAIMPFAAGKGLFAMNYVLPLLNPATASHFRETAYSLGGSAIGIKIDYGSPLGFVLTYGYSLITLLIGPFVWQIRSFGQIVALPEAVVMAVLLFVICGRTLRGRLRNRHAAVLVFPALALAMIMAVFADNIGTNTRLRILPWTLMVIVFATSSTPKSRDALEDGA